MSKKIILIMAVICISIFLCGCGNQQPSTVDDSKATSENVNDVVSANNNFAFDLYSRYKSDEGNIFFSPYSISTALAMTYEGARGKTAEEMRNVFHFPDDELSRRSAYAKLYNEINKKDKGYKLSTANALWGQKDFSFLKIIQIPLRIIMGENSRILISRQKQKNQGRQLITGLRARPIIK